MNKLRSFSGTLRIVYSEAKDYSPTLAEYEASKEQIEKTTTFPRRGFDSIIRTKSLTSIRMQGQPITLVAFTSFNEQLVRHMLGSISPHRLLFVNCRSPRSSFEWRERATQEIHQKQIDEYSSDNPQDEKGFLKRVASTLYYKESIDVLEKIYNQFGKTVFANWSIIDAGGESVIEIEYKLPFGLFKKEAVEKEDGLVDKILSSFIKEEEALSRDLRGHTLLVQKQSGIDSNFNYKLVAPSNWGTTWVKSPSDETPDKLIYDKFFGKIFEVK